MKAIKQQPMRQEIQEEDVALQSHPPITLNAKVIAIEHKNVQGKSLYYLSIRNQEGKELYMNVGQGTYNTIQKMTN